MATKYVGLNEAAQLLGVTPDELNDMRSHSEIHGYRDGASWKFKWDEVERVAREQNINLDDATRPAAADATGSLSDLLSSSDLSMEESTDDLASESILVSDESLGESGSGTSSTVIGKKSSAGSQSESDIRVGSESGSGTGSDVELVADAGGSEVRLVPGDSNALAGSDILASRESGTGAGGSQTGQVSLGGSDVKLAGDSSMAGGPSRTQGDSDLTLDDSASSLSGSESAIELASEGDEELVLGGSGGGSDVTGGTSDSGISLKPDDSGLSLEEQPLDLSGSSIEALELPEDEDVITMEDSADPDAATQLKADDEFLLTPVEELADDESSGSQVIALEDSEAFDQGMDQDAAVAPLEPMLVEEEGAAELGAEFEAQPAGAAAAAPMTMPTQFAPAAEPEAHYSVINVLSLLAVFVVLAAAGIMMVDVMQNLWQYEGAGSLGNTLTNFIADTFSLTGN
jgi:hypothetical protein